MISNEPSQPPNCRLYRGNQPYTSSKILDAHIGICLTYRFTSFPFDNLNSNVASPLFTELSLLAIRAAFIVGESVHTKKRRTKIPASIALQIKPTLPLTDNTISNIKLLPSAKHCYRNYSQ